MRIMNCLYLQVRNEKMKILLRPLTVIVNKEYIYFTPKRFSALFINGPKATESFLYLTPYIDFLERMKHEDLVKEELHKRQSNINLSKLKDLWCVYDELKVTKTNLDCKKQTIYQELQDKIKANIKGNDVEKIKIQLNLIKDNIKKLKVPLWSAEEVAIVEALKLPNKLHQLTPVEKNKVIHEHMPQQSNNKHHMEIAKQHDLIHFTKNENYYLKHDAAIFEIGAQFHFSNILKQNKFTKFSNPDFAKSLIVEGCGQNHTDPNSTFILHHNEDSKVHIDNRLHLTGAGSLLSFFAYHAKTVVHGTVLPLKYFTLGRQYVPSSIEQNNLFHVSQSSAVQMFAVMKNDAELDQILQEMLDIIKHAYEPLGFHFRITYVQANKLQMWESLRVAIEMYSNSIKDYVEIGNISVSGDFISKRLMFTYTEDKQSKFPHVISGTILNVPKFLACILEQDEEFSLPFPFKVENWISI